MSRRSFDLSKQNEFSVIDFKSGKDVKKSTVPIICERIRYYREMIGMERKALASALGVTGNAVSNWETGRTRPDINLIPKICTALCISPFQLFDMACPSPQFSEDELELVDHFRELTPGNKRAVRILASNLRDAQIADTCPEIVVLRYIERGLAAGTADPSEFDDSATPIYLYASERTEHADYVFRVSGDSMEPEYHNNDMVLVQAIPEGPDLKHGEVGAFMKGNEQFIKVYEEDGLRSLNPAYPFMDFSETDETVYIIGRVVGTMNPAQDIAAEADVSKYRLVHFEGIGNEANKAARYRLPGDPGADRMLETGRRDLRAGAFLSV